MALSWKLIWNQVASEEWQAGGEARYYSIMRDGARFNVALCSADRRISSVASTDSLATAQDAAALHASHNAERRI